VKMEKVEQFYDILDGITEEEKLRVLISHNSMRDVIRYISREMGDDLVIRLEENKYDGLETAEKADFRGNRRMQLITPPNVYGIRSGVEFTPKYMVVNCTKGPETAFIVIKNAPLPKVPEEYRMPLEGLARQFVDDKGDLHELNIDFLDTGNHPMLILPRGSQYNNDYDAMAALGGMKIEDIPEYCMGKSIDDFFKDLS